VLRRIGCGLAALALLVSPAPGGESCGCEAARRSHGWCDGCGVGFIAGVEIRSEVVWEALDAHGHDLDPAGLTCPECAAAYLHDGFCEEHRLGFVRGQAYYSRLTYHIAAGETVDPATLACPACRAHARSSGWCDEHHVGMIGNVAIRDRDAFEDAAVAYRTLLAALERIGQCELCAAAMAIDGRCPVHKLAFTDGVGRPAP